MARQDRIYFAQRAAEEMEAASKAAHPKAVETHRLLQRRYLERALVGERTVAQEKPDFFGDNRASFAPTVSEG